MRIVTLSVLVSLAALNTGCGKSLISGATVTTRESGGQAFAEARVGLNLGGIALPQLSLPISGGVGSVRTGSDAGRSFVAIDVNLMDALRAPSADGQLLPNGRAIPVGNASQVDVVGLSVGSRSRVYLAVDGRNAMLGFALVIPELDAVTRIIPIAIDLFPSFSVSNGIRGVAGFFSSPEAQRSGLAVFLSSEALAQGRMVALTADTVSESGVLSFQTHRSGSSTEQSRLEQGLLRLQSRQTRVQVR